MDGQIEPIKNIAINNDGLVHTPGGVSETERGLRSGRFKTGDVLDAFDADFLDEERCRSWVMNKLHPDGGHCPRCGADIPDRQMRGFWSCKRMKCGRCGKFFTALTGTFLSGCHLKFREIVLLALLLALEVPDKQIASILHMSAENVRLWRIKFKAMETKHAD